MLAAAKGQREMRESANLAHCQFATPQRSKSNLGKFGPLAASPRSPPSKSRRERERARCAREVLFVEGQPGRGTSRQGVLFKLDLT